MQTPKMSRIRDKDIIVKGPKRTFPTNIVYCKSQRGREVLKQDGDHLN